MYTIGLDIGTTKICAVLFDIACGKTVRTLSASNASSVVSAHDEHLQDPEKIFSLCTALIDSLIDDFPEIQSIGICGQMHGILYAGKNGDCLSMLHTWQDQRSARLTGNSISYCESVFDKTGYTLRSGYGFATHFYNILHGLTPDQPYRMTTISGYIAMKLCARTSPVLHISDAAGLGLFNIGNARFDETALSILNISPKTLPEIASDYRQVGQYRGIPVGVGIGDNQAAWLGSTQHDGDILINIGTGSQITSVNRHNSNRLELRPLHDKTTLCVGSALCGGRAYSVLKNLVADVLTACGVEPPQDIYSVLNAAVALADQSLRCDTRFAGTEENPSITGSITGISCDNFKLSNLSFAFLKGMAEELFHFYQRLGEINDVRLIGSGNAIRKNNALRNIIEQTFKLKLHIPARQEEAACGAAMFGAVCANVITYIEDVKKLTAYI